jgi:hypothetical protein
MRQLFGVAAIALLVGPPSASAQTRDNLGPGQCVNCHAHQDEKEWSEKKDGDGKGKTHLKALDQLEDPKAAGFAKALNLADKYDVKGTCVRCHATIVRASADFGVTCESCHGGGKDYLTPHQTAGDAGYSSAIKLGMNDVKGKPAAWVRQCASCHVLGANPGDAALIKAGHPSGDQFDLTTKFQTVAAHWQSKYTASQIAPLAATLRNTNAAPATTTALAATTSAPANVPKPIAPTTIAPTTIAPTTTAPGRSPATTTAATTTAATTIAATTTTGGRPNAPSTTSLVAAPAPAPTPAPAVQSASASVARVVRALDKMLAAGATTNVAARMPPANTFYAGTDGELLRLQQEVIELALVALRTAPPK